MFEIFALICMLVGAFYILVKSAEFLLVSASVLGHRAGLSKFVIGLTIIAIGTSLPELFTAISGTLFSQNVDSFVIGTILGSNISNILLIFGLLLLFSSRFTSHTHKEDIFMLAFSTIALLSLIFLKKFTIIYGIIFLFIYGLYLYLDIKRKERKKFEEETKEAQTSILSKKNNLIVLAILSLSIAGLNFSSKSIVFAIDNLGLVLNIPSVYLTMTTVALATSLPEAIVTYQSAKSREFDLAIGNIIGSNISNVFMITGVISLVKQFSFNASTYWHGSIILIIATIIFMFYITRKNLKKIHGATILGIYFFYIISTFLL